MLQEVLESINNYFVPLHAEKRTYTISDGRITPEITIDALEMQGVDSLGLDPLDRKYLETICRVFRGGPVGVDAVAHTMNVASDSLIDEVEPFLLRSELMIRTPRGRKITAKGIEHLGLNPDHFDLSNPYDRPENRSLFDD